ncbi:unnamed protein product [Lactuca virosa]|uniref:Ubiquitin-like protease family profile domain-containing protein n=1 Tax=Lactuca virosa TaxID=75947 RepID=A0AAU9MX30_9ASTR|nr:unnamed protein product [Lactuca virosa]
MFSSQQIPQALTWHAQGRFNNGKLTHPRDTASWKLVDSSWKEFGQEKENLRLALFVDGYYSCPICSKNTCSQWLPKPKKVLFNKIKYGPPERDHGICFMNSVVISPSTRKGKSKNIDVASRGVSDRLSTRKDNDIIILPYNPGRHWVLVVLDMKLDTCYYLDSLGSGNFNMQLKQIIDSSMVLYATQSGSNKRIKLNWCPVQARSTECGYYMLKFMKEIVEEGIEVLVKDNVRR